MKIKVTTIDIEISRHTKRLALMLGIPMLVVGIGAVAIAAVPNTFKDGDVLSADKMNQNFADLDSRIVALEQSTSKVIYSHAGKTYSINAGFCGKTQNYNGAQVSGYDGAKQRCEAACGSPSAHMCTAEELIRSQATDPAGTAGAHNAWYSFGGRVKSGDSANQLSDCLGWTSNANVEMGPVWDTSAGPNDDRCDTVKAIACCD